MRIVLGAFGPVSLLAPLDHLGWKRPLAKEGSLSPMLTVFKFLPATAGAMRAMRKIKRRKK